MRQTLFFIPHEAGGVPLFGFGGALVWLWLALSAAVLLWLARRQGWNADTRSYLPLVLMVAVALAVVLPFLESSAPDGTRLGLPIRGYGMMMLAGFVAAVALASRHARRMGLNPEIILSLAFWMFVAGITGARLFYIVEYWKEFSQPSIGATLVKIFKFTDGGLVVYGSALGAGIAVVGFMRIHRLPQLAMADLIAPFLMVGLALGRVGCLLNGCCYGGVCEESAWGLTFPASSPPYLDQLHTGELIGARLVNAAGGRVVESVRPGSEADLAGIQAGDRVTLYRAPRGDDLERAASEPSTGAAAVRLITDKGVQLAIPFSGLPSTSRPVHATQIYSAVNAALLFLVLWSFYPFRRRDGQVCALLLTLYPLSRFLLEMIRVDESGLAGTDLSIGQWVSLATLVGAIVLWCVVARQPAGSALPPAVVH